MPLSRIHSSVAGLLLIGPLLPACGLSLHSIDPGRPLSRRGDEISVCGQLFHTGTPVILWNDPGGYDAYRVEPRFPDELSPEALAAYEFKANYHTLRNHLSETDRTRILKTGWTLNDLRDAVDLFVIHYDACGTSRQCFKVLQDRRHLSVHFLLDVDGTLYQTLDLKERAWHAAEANDRSVGVEIAQIGAYQAADHERLRGWYREGPDGLRIAFPDSPDSRLETGIHTKDFVARPARPELLSGPVHGRLHYQYDFTDAQYLALARLTATLTTVLPRIALRVPRDEQGELLTRALDGQEFAEYSGLLGHSHVTERKVDPGPAFDWERLLRESRKLVGPRQVP